MENIAEITLFAIVCTAVLTVTHANPLGVTDDSPTIRLVGGEISEMGRVEVLQGDVWGTVCGIRFGEKDAKVACRALGLNEAFAHVFGERGYFGQGTGRVVHTRVNCNGTESSLGDCDNFPDPYGYCQNHKNDIGVYCPAEKTENHTTLRLVGGDNPNEGRVEVNYFGFWGTVCDWEFGQEEARVVCRALGLPVIKANVWNGVPRGTGAIVYDSLNCTGDELSLDDCSHEGGELCKHYDDVGVKCPAVCSPNPCSNGGNCARDDNLPTGYECSCPFGYTGTNCGDDIDFCSSNPCSNGGNCTNDDSFPTGYECSCPFGYTGTNCGDTVYFCLSNPCSNGGNCTNLPTGYECSCPFGYTGTNCGDIVDFCLSNPCSNGGNCARDDNSPTGYECSCPFGYTGTNCADDIDFCSSAPCLQGGTCTEYSDSPNGYRCTCTPGYRGTNCEKC